MCKTMRSHIHRHREPAQLHFRRDAIPLASLSLKQNESVQKLAGWGALLALPTVGSASMA